MANSRSGNVIIVDTDATTLTESLDVVGIKWVPGTGTPSVTIKKNDTNGKVVYSNTATTQGYEAVKFRLNKGFITLAGTGSILYIYLK